ncbi:MAG: glycosyltransferase family 2 protein [Gammaproteobacteria bacterium]|nr:glycosyltransferase family 2 protein [Gammaproteobacteria bacterium]
MEGYIYQSREDGVTNLRNFFNHVLVITLSIIFTALIFFLTLALAAWIGGQVFPTMEVAIPRWISITFLAYLCFYLIGIIFPFMLFLGWRQLKFPIRTNDNKTTPFVTLVIPAYNEQNTMAKSLKSAMEQDYPNYEIIVVDDGSLDFTPYTVDNDSIRFIRLRRNRGKAAALNAGIDQAKGDIIMFSDSDSRLDKSAIRYMVEHFNDPTVGAVAGKVCVTNNNIMLECWQNLEYLQAQTIMKQAQIGNGGSVTVCPGPACAVRRSVLFEMGGYKDRTLVEDFDATLEIIGLGYRTVYEPRAIAWTNVPRRWRVLGSQRTRWYRGNLQVLSLYRDILLRRRAGSIGLFWLPYSLFSGFGAVLFEIAMLASFPVLLYFSGAALKIFAMGLIIMVLIELMVSLQYLIPLAIEKELKPKLIFAALTVKPYHLFLSWIRLVAICREAKKQEATWAG